MSLIFLTCWTYAQNTLEFTGVYATPENAIQLHWNSNPGEFYEVDYATSLIDTNTGVTTWNPLYVDFPSHGTNTFILDTGDYNVSPPIPHPKKDVTRLYRVVLMGNDTAQTEPTVSIISPINNSIVSNNIAISVSVSSPDVIAETKLYVDGQEMPPSITGTNFVINTCEWWNGKHTLFATTKSLSHFEGLPNDTSVTYGHAVSGYLNLYFNNLISEVSFSEPFFEPELGQTQLVTASFAENCDWELRIQDVNSNTVRNVIGSGSSMSFAWDGNGNGGTNIPKGVYFYNIFAQKNGLKNSLPIDSVSLASELPQSDNFTTQQYVVDESGGVLPLALYPPGFNTNLLTIVDATEADIQSTKPIPFRSMSASSKPKKAAMALYANQGGSTPNFGNTASSETTTAPTRPPITPGAGTIGTFFVGYNACMIQSGSFVTPPIETGWPWPITPQYVALDGRSQANAKYDETWSPIYENTAIANGFAYVMQNGRWKGSINRNIQKSDVLGGVFNQANVGMLCVHGSYGNTAETDGIKHSYLRFFDQNTFQKDYCRLDDCSFVSPGTNGLKFMTLLVCNALNDIDYNNMYNYGRLPINGDLHLLLGCSTVASAAPSLGGIFALRLIGDGTTNNTREMVWQAFFDAGQYAYNLPYPNAETNHIVISFRASGWPDAFSEYVTDVANSPGTSNPLDITKIDRVVFANP